MYNCFEKKNRTISNKKKILRGSVVKIKTWMNKLTPVAYFVLRNKEYCENYQGF